MENINKEHRKRVYSRFDEHGLAAFSDHEKLELLLFYSIPRADTKATAKYLLKEFGDLKGVFKATEQQLKSIKGVGPASVRLIKLVKALKSEIALADAIAEPVISSPKSLFEYMKQSMFDLHEESLRVVFVDTKNKIIKIETISTGEEDQTAVYPRKIMKRALALNSTGVLVVHNHPSGDPAPSNSDINVTNALCNAAETLGLRLLDHLIVAGNNYFSFREKGLI